MPPRSWPRSASTSATSTSLSGSAARLSLLLARTGQFIYLCYFRRGADMNGSAETSRPDAMRPRLSGVSFLCCD
jgi:hypothetical protein